MKKLRITDVTWSLTCDPESVPLRGNVLASGNDVADKRAERSVQRQLDNGNEWAWCCVCVRGEWKGLTAEDTLGCCSYASRDEFVNAPYYDDMRNVVLASLQRQLDVIVEAVEGVEA